MRVAFSDTCIRGRAVRAAGKPVRNVTCVSGIHHQPFNKKEYIKRENGNKLTTIVPTQLEYRRNLLGQKEHWNLDLDFIINQLLNKRKIFIGRRKI